MGVVGLVVLGCPADGVGGATGHTAHLDALQPVHKGRLPVDAGPPVALLAVVVVAPGKYLDRYR